ncbi:MAG: NAD-dependent epimerase/dehydratase family protein [Pseudomonadota bacterium]
MAQNILLTGVTGFIAKRIAQDLLAAGHEVCGSLRSPAREGEVRAALGDPEALSFATLDLSSDDGWAAAMEGRDALLHTASPFPLEDPKHEDELIRPAVDGTLRALRSAQAAGVTRVVLTSSVVAMIHADRPKGHLYGPGDWTDLDHPTSRAYVKSKTLAERAAWDFVADHPEMELTVINPGFVLGRPLDGKFGTSLSVIERILGGKDPAVPDLGFPTVDVADVSRLHVEALARPATIGKRIVAAGDYRTMPEIAALLKDAYPGRKITTRVAPRWLLRVIGLFDPAVRSITPQVGFHTPTDNSETRAIYEMEFIPARDAILASADAVLTA